MSGNRFKNNDYYCSQLKNGDYNIISLEEYTGVNNPILHKCTLCGYEYYAKPHNILRHKSRCKNCKFEKIDSDFKEKINRINSNIKIISKYSGNSNCKMDIQCLSCGNIWSTSASALYVKRECQKCGKITNTIQSDDFINRVKKLSPDFEIISDYSIRHNNYLCRCINCGYEKIYGRNWILSNKIMCPKCNEAKSRGEIKIYDFLIEHKIEFIPQKTFNDLFGTREGYLSYDFYLPKYNILIEFQGIQHEKRISYMQTQKEFERQKIHDLRKRIYAKNNGIKLITIWYYEYNNIDKILINTLNLKSVETAGCA